MYAFIRCILIQWSFCLYLDSTCNIDPCIPNPCLSNGTCHSIVTSTNYTCSCLEQYSGKRCEFRIKSDSKYALSHDIPLNHNENNSDNSRDLWPLAVVFGYVFSLMLVFIIIWFLW